MASNNFVDLMSTDMDDEDEGVPNLFEISPYYSTEDAIQILKSKLDTLKLLSLNCQSIQAKFSQLQIYLKNFENSECPFSIICVQETWLSEEHDISLIQLNGYNFIHKTRTCSLHGGVGIYLKDTIDYKVLPIDSNQNIWDGIFVEISLDLNDTLQKKKIIIGNIYRPPRECSENYLTFNEDMQRILSSFSNTNAEIVLTGDFNIDLLKILEKEHVTNFMETFLSNGLLPKITLPTRLTHHSQTLIDNCFIKLSVNFSKTTAGILTQNISDHHPYFVVFDYLKPKKYKHRMTKVHLNTDEARAKFKHEISHSLTREKLTNLNPDDPNYNYDVFDNVIKAALDKHMPSKLVKFKKHKHRKSDWITQGIIHSIKFRDKMYQRFRATPVTDVLHNTLKVNLQTYNRILKQSIRRAKANYYKTRFDKYKDDMKGTWQTIKEIINRNTNLNNLPTTFIIGNEEQNNPHNIVNAFNEYFVKIGPDLASKIQVDDPRVSFLNYLKIPTNSTFQFEQVSEEAVLKIINELKPKTSCGKDGVSNKLLKYIKSEVTPALTLIINQSIKTGIFPDKLKIAKVLPVYKKNDPKNFENYRPISVLSSVSKVFERVLHDQLYKYFNEQKLFYEGQYGFRCQHSTELAALEILDRIVCAMDSNEIPINIYLDLSKAFDTLDHQILLNKFKYYGVQNMSLNLLNSYLCNRQQYVVFNDVYSDFKPISTGVPQGSILGPLFFIIYLNDLSRVCNMFKPVIYADDTTLFAVLEVFGINTQELEQNINYELQLITTWFKANRLSINARKTKAMLFHNPQRKVNNISIQLDGSTVEFVQEFNYLGIFFDVKLSWKSHINHTAKKVSRTIGVMNKLKYFLPGYILHTLYNSLIYPHLNYGILVWGQSATKLFKLQKKSIRLIANEKYNAHTQPLFKALQLLTINDILKLQELKFIYKLENQQLPPYFLSLMCRRQSEIHGHDTRYSHDYRNLRSKHVFVKKSVRYRLPSILNNCPTNIKEKIYTHSYPGYVRYAKQEYIKNYDTVCQIPNCYICQNAR